MNLGILCKLGRGVNLTWVRALSWFLKGKINLIVCITYYSKMFLYFFRQTHFFIFLNFSFFFGL